MKLLFTLFLCCLLVKNGTSQELFSKNVRPDLVKELENLSQEDGTELLRFQIEIIRKLSGEGEYLKAYEHALWLLEQDSIYKDQPGIQRKLYMRFGALMEELELYDLAREFQLKLSESIYSKRFISPRLYMKLGKPDSAIWSCRIELFEKIKNDRPLSHFSAYNDLGYYHENADNIDSARYYYLIALKGIGGFRINKKNQLNARVINGLEISVRENLARLLIKEGKYVLAILDIDKIYQVFGEHLKVKSSGIRMQWIRLNQKKMDAVIGLKDYALLIKMLTELEQMNLDPNFWHGEVYRKRQECLNDYWIKYYLKVGDMKTLEKRLHKRDIYTDSLQSHIKLQRNLVSSKSISSALGNLSKEKNLLNQLLQKKFLISEERTKSRNLLIIVSIIGIGIISFFFLFYLLYQRKKRLQLAEEEKGHLNSLLKLEEKNSELVKNDLINRQKDLVDLSIRIKRERRWANELVELHHSLKRKNVENPQEQLNVIVDEIKNSLIVDEKQRLIKDNVELLSQEFRLLLKNKFPNLVETEIELCELIRLNLSNSEIARVRNISPDSARKSRYRLKMKMGLTKDQSILDVLAVL